MDSSPAINPHKTNSPIQADRRAATPDTGQAALYNKEIAPAFGERVPVSIQLGMVLVDWDANQTSSRDLLARLARLEHDAPELSRDMLRDLIDQQLLLDKGKELGVIDQGATGKQAALLVIGGGTGAYARATGFLQLRGTLGAGGQVTGDYLGEICTAR